MVLGLRGEVDADVALEMKGVEVVAGVDRTLVVDLSGVVFIDIAGLRLLEALARSGVRFRGESDAVQRLVALVGRPDLLPPEAAP